MKRIIVLIVLIATIFTQTTEAKTSGKVIDVSDYGILPNTKENISPLVTKMMESLKPLSDGKNKITIYFPKGRYDFHEEGSSVREYFISNHDQTNPKKVGIELNELKNVTIQGNNSLFVFHGRMLPIAFVGTKNCTISSISIDFETPHIAQVQIIKNDPETGITFQVAPWVNYRIAENGRFETFGEDWTAQQAGGIAFEEKTKRLVYRTSDLSINTVGSTNLSNRQVHAPQWKDSRLIPGTVVAMRTWARPTPGIFLSECTDTKLENINVHYAEGMGLLAQVSENITLSNFSVRLKGESDPRYFTTQADATHFSGCKGKIISHGGLYEGMMDDAINIHGTYLKVIKRIDNNTLVGKYMHGQSYGFKWGDTGDRVQFINSSTMELIGSENTIASITPTDKPTNHGAKEFTIKFKNSIDPLINEQSTFGIENLEWTPSVHFYANTIRNNRARGSLFSTPKLTVVEDNLFDHTSGTAILLCGDCNGWFETGACKKVIIRNNRFINSLTNMFQFTNAIISIYPEIPNLKDQQKYFHGGKKGAIKIENNLFDTFDTPILYAKSTDGLTFKNNTILQNSSYPAFHQNTHRFWFQRVKNYDIRNNSFYGESTQETDIKLDLYF